MLPCPYLSSFFLSGWLAAAVRRCETGSVGSRGRAVRSITRGAYFLVEYAALRDPEIYRVSVEHGQSQNMSRVVLIRHPSRHKRASEVF